MGGALGDRGSRDGEASKCRGAGHLARRLPGTRCRALITDKRELGAGSWELGAQSPEPRAQTPDSRLQTKRRAPSAKRRAKPSQAKPSQACIAIRRILGARSRATSSPSTRESRAARPSRGAVPSRHVTEQRRPHTPIAGRRPRESRLANQPPRAKKRPRTCAAVTVSTSASEPRARHGGARAQGRAALSRYCAARPRSR